MIAERAKEAWLEFPRHLQDLEFPNKALEWAAIWPEAFTSMNNCINMAQAHMPNKLCPWEKLYKRRATRLPLPFMMHGVRHRNRKNKTESKGERCFHLNTGNNHSSTTHKILLSSGVCSYPADVTPDYRRGPFVGEVTTWGGGEIVDASAAVSTVAPAAAKGTGSGVFPAASARGTAAARGGVFPTPPMTWTTAPRDQPPESATTQRRRYQVIPAVTRSGSRLTGMSGAFALLKADEKIVHSLATAPEAGGDLELPAVLPCDLETPETYAQAHPGPHGRIWGAAARKEFTGLTAIGTPKPAGVSV